MLTFPATEEACFEYLWHDAHECKPRVQSIQLLAQRFPQIHVDHGMNIFHVLPIDSYARVLVHRDSEEFLEEAHGMAVVEVSVVFGGAKKLLAVTRSHTNVFMNKITEATTFHLRNFVL